MGEGLTAAAPTVLEGQATDDADRRLRGRSLTWFAGRRRLGTGEKLRVKLPAGRVRLRLVARDSRRRTRTASRRVRIAPVPLEIKTLRARSVRAGVRSTTMTLATNVPGTLRVRGRRYEVGRRARRLEISLPVEH